MFFITGFRSGKKAFRCKGQEICATCGAYGRYSMVMTYNEITLFFIPLFKVSKKYYLYKNCCDNLYQISPALGKRIAKGEDVEVREEDLIVIEGRDYKSYKCGHCHFVTKENFEFCPKCGAKFS